MATRKMVIKKVRFDSYAIWNDNRGSYYLVMVDHENHQIEFESLGGSAPNVDAFYNFCMSDKDIRKELLWAMTEYKRTYPFYFTYRAGSSGCEDVSMFVSKGKHRWSCSTGRNSEKIFNLHISSCSKLNEGIPDFFSGDLCELLRWMYDSEDDLDETSFEFYREVKNKKIKRCEYKYMKYKHHFIHPQNPICGWAGGEN